MYVYNYIDFVRPAMITYISVCSVLHHIYRNVVTTYLFYYI